ncbi:MAG: hypothetical protein ACQGVK_05940 [Myxococcota bacterium]
MRRIHAFELEDQSWFPAVLRDAGTAYLRFVGDRTGQADNVRPVIESALERSGESRILDLCSGGGGPVLGVARALREAGRPVEVTLTDFFPNAPARQLVERGGDPASVYEAESVDATRVPAERPGLRTFFNSFHHFRPGTARRILADAVSSGRPIAVVEVLSRSPLALLGILFAPIVVFLAVPFLRPFRPAWLVFTYLLPVIPLFVLWDGLVSVLRIYDEAELRSLAEGADPEGRFDWRVESIPMPPAPVPGIALVGVPRSRSGG